MMTEVPYKRNINFNLFTIGRCLINGWKLSGDADHVVVLKVGIRIMFDIVSWTKQGELFCCMLKRGAGTTINTASSATKGRQHMSMTKAQHVLGHTNRRATIKPAKQLGWGQLKDSCKICQPTR